MDRLVDFCYTEDNSLNDDVCDTLIRMYNEQKDHHERFDLNRSPNFTQFNFTEHKGLDIGLHNHLVNVSIKAINKYKSIVPETVFWPERFSFEYFRIKHYRANTDDQFDVHIDANNKDNSKRFLAFFWYLNDVEEGGETQFVNFELSIKPKKGRLFMFPPLWMYPHLGSIALSNDKYLLSSYMHFA